MVAVSDYARKDGTHVRAHSRSAPGARNQLAILALAAIAVAGVAGGGDQGAGGQNAKAPEHRTGGKVGPVPVVRIVMPDHRASQSSGEER